MRLHFESDLDFQLAAVRAVTDLFRGQEVCRSTFTVARETGMAQQAFTDDGIGVGNRLHLIDEDLLRNLQAVQERAGLPIADRLASRDFTVEMETGTGKTYVYLRTLFELNRLYGFTKFVIVVPSVAIKEGVFKTLQITRDHFEALYPQAKGFECFLYDSGRPGQVRNFAVSTQVQVMVVTVGAINKKEVNNLYKVSEKTNDVKPIDLIVQTSPVVIVDEPQSVDGGLTGAGKTALEAMQPLCTLRYSATHLQKHHMVHRLTAVEAYQRKLVKQIEVIGRDIEGDHNQPYLRVVSVTSRRRKPVLEVELDVQVKTRVSRCLKTFEVGNIDLAQETERAIYANWRIVNFGLGRAAGEPGWVELGHLPHRLKEGEVIGDMDPGQLQRLMIRRTIHEHLAKERRLRPRGIKVLSLFFLAAVDQYRTDAGPGPVARMFHEEFLDAARSAPDLYPPEGLEALAQEVHAGYFARDRQGRAVEVELDAAGQLKNEASREAAARAYALIMRDKEALLDLATPLRFIFSHSALREGWDNPNVFQICNLRDMHSERERRQTLGRGLRICVDQSGQRVRDPSINTLTIVASERFGDYAEKLQQEIEQDTGMRFGVITEDLFAAITVRQENGTVAPLGAAAAAEIQRHLLDLGYVDRHGTVQDTLRQALKDGTVSLPPAYAPQAAAIINGLRDRAGSLEIRDRSQRRPIRRNKQVFESPEFTALWERIRPKTTYRVAFDQEALVRACVADLRDDLPAIPRTSVTFITGVLDIDQGGVRAQVREESAPCAVHTGHIPLPDVLGDLQERTGLTRRTIGRILLESGRLDDFAKNPQRFIEEVAERIARRKRHALVDGIRYQRIGDAAWFVQELFPDEELVGYLKEAVATPGRGVYEQVLVDSGTERTFAEELERNQAVKVFAKLPSNFRVPTPLGDYIPDWAVLVEQAGQERLYLVVETKSSRFDDDLREQEKDKIACGRQHFLALSEADPAHAIGFKAKITRVAELFTA